ncbi:MAG: histidine kinase [Actinomycetaceae bacterium]|nr:histidine kinase [Actinomycetaceae bacterium]
MGGQFFQRFFRGRGLGTRAQTLAAEVVGLRESRRAIVDAFEIERRRIEGDLHDGAQQYLVATGLKIGEAAWIAQQLTELLMSHTPETSTATTSKAQELATLLSQAQELNDLALVSLRHTVRDVHPQVLTDHGLEVAVRELIGHAGLQPKARLAVPHPLPVLPDGVASTAYFLVSEALTNAAKYAPGAQVSVMLAADDALHVSVVDEGPGGACITKGHGLAGLTERLAAFGGTVNVISPPGGPTTVRAQIPLLLRTGESGLTPI